VNGRRAGSFWKFKDHRCNSEIETLSSPPFTLFLNYTPAAHLQDMTRSQTNRPQRRSRATPPTYYAVKTATKKKRPIRKQHWVQCDACDAWYITYMYVLCPFAFSVDPPTFPSLRWKLRRALPGLNPESKWHCVDAKLSPDIFDGSCSFSPLQKTNSLIFSFLPFFSSSHHLINNRRNRPISRRVPSAGVAGWRIKHYQRYDFQNEWHDE
jgi:hypothetical protein